MRYMMAKNVKEHKDIYFWIKQKILIKYISINTKKQTFIYDILRKVGTKYLFKYPS